MQTILTTEQMKNCEQRSAECGTSLAQLMDNAGEALARAVLERCMKNGLHNCTILAGKGNNGGDGFVAANHLSFAGVKVKVLLCCGQPCTELAAAAFVGIHWAWLDMIYDGVVYDSIVVSVSFV